MNFSEYYYLIESPNKKYHYYNNCKDFEDGNEVNSIVDWDDTEYSENTYFHNPEYQITKQQFLKMIDQPIDNYDYYGFNPKLDIVFGYILDNDRHDFYE